MRIELPIKGGSSQSKSIDINNQRSINMYPRIEGAGARSPVGLYQTPGLENFQTLGTGPCRSNGIQFNDNIYFVSGPDVIEINSVYSGATIGTMTSTTGRVSGAAGRSYLMLVDGTDGYTYDGTTFAKITDLDFPASPSHVTILDGYFIVNRGGTDEYYISANEDPTSWNALDFGTAENNPDEILALTASFKDLYLIGNNVTETHYNSRNPDFPFESYPSGVIEVGIRAKHSLARSSMGLFFLASNKDGDAIVVAMNGPAFQVISDLDIAREINSLSVTSDATGSIYRQNGESFYVLTFPAADRTFVYDLQSRIWHERKSRDIGRWKVSGIGYVGEKVVVGVYNSGKFHYLSDSKFDEDGAILERTRDTQITHRNGVNIQYDEVEVVIQAGVGLTTGQGSDPQIMLSYSDDSGRTWSDELWASMGKIGEYETRLIWNKLGASTNRMFRLKVTDPVNYTIVACYADVRELAF